MIGKFKKVALVLLVLVSLLILLLSGIVTTHVGSRWVVQRAAQLMDIQVGAVQGNLLAGLDLSSADYVKNDLSVHAEKIVFRWQPLALFYTAISMQSLSAENIRVHLPDAKKNPQQKILTWPSLAQPLRIELKNLQLSDIHIQQGDSQLLLNNISGSLSVGTFHLRIKDLLVDNAQCKTQTNGTIGLSYPYSLALTSQWQFAAASTPDLMYKGSVDLSGDIKKIQLKQNLQQPFLLTSTASIAPALQDKKQKPYADILNEWPAQAIPHTLIEPFINKEKFPFLVQLLTTQGHLQLQGWLDQYQLQGNLQATTAEAELTADIKLQGTHINDNSETASAMKWQLEKLLISSQTKAGDNRVVEKSFLQLSGGLSFSPAIEWNFILQGEHINAAHFFADWPSDLHVNVTSKGEFKNQQDFSAPNWKVAINNMNVEGNLRGLNLTSNGTINFDGSHWQSSDLKIALGANQLSFKGKAGADLAVEWKINAPILNQIDPSISGSIISSGNFSGDLTQPNVQINAKINQLLWRDYAVNALTINVNPEANNRYTLALSAEHLQLQGQRIAQLTLKADGSIEQHKITAALQSPAYGNIDFSLDSGWKDNLWRGQWRNFSIDIKKIPRWYLSSSAPMQADKNHGDFGELCLTSATRVSAETQSLLDTNHLPHSNMLLDVIKKLTGQSVQKSNVDMQEVPRLCIASTWNSNSGFNANLNLLAVPLQQMRAWVKPDVTLQGVIDAQLSLQTMASNTLTANWHLQTRNAQCIYQFQGGDTETYALKQGVLNGTLKNNQMVSTLLMDWGQYGVINAKSTYTLADKKVQANITAALADLAPLESLMPALNNVQGSASANINMTGSIDKPDITGSLNIKNSSANVPKLGLELKEISVQIASEATGVIHMDGELLSGDGQLKIKGDFTNVGAENWHGKGNIFGANIRIIQQPELTATVSPNLTFTADAGAINLNGTTEIPWARTAIKTLPSSAIRVSNDVTIIESDNYLSPKGAAKNIIPFYTNVLLYFGEDVRFKGFGLDGQLSGKINVFKEANHETFTTGFVAVNNGVYKAYGQELSIARGRLLFQGPYDNPGLDIRALRTIETEKVGEPIIAGLEVGGTLQNPRSSVFSIPTLDDSNAMALLLTGKVKDQLSVGDAYTLITAVSSMGVEKGSMITADIAHFFRLDEITIKSEKGVEQSQLWMGKYITPKLFMRYVVGLFDQAFTLGLRYQLNDKLRVEAESGKNQSVDMIYKIER